jgi:hypothetical protein
MLLMDITAKRIKSQHKLLKEAHAVEELLLNAIEELATR